ncbi:MAG: beta-ketoacyl-[acyl-carrier-protein] synthase family protein [Chloroflexota bacterium]
MASDARGVVITGAGLVTPLGLGVEENWAGVKALRTGIGHYPKDDLPPFLQYMGKVPQFDLPGDISHKLLGQMKFLNRGSLLGFAASREALIHSGIDLSGTEPGRRALYVASGDTTMVGYEFMYPAVKDATGGKWQTMDSEKLNRATLDKVNPFFLLESILNNLFSFLSAYLEFMGPNTTLASHSPCGGNALELAHRSIARGSADVALAVGCGNWITEIPLYEMQGLGVISRCRLGAASYRPFDKGRDGFIPGEGAAAILMEASDVAEKRKARVLARVGGFGNSIEPPDGRALVVPRQVSARCMREAVEEAECGLSDLAFVCPHGSGSLKGDRSELRSLREVLGGKMRDVPVCGLKPYTGHLGAASDIAEVIFSVKALHEHIVPATLNFTESEREFSDFRITSHHQSTSERSFLSISYGIGGQSSSVVVHVS